MSKDPYAAILGIDSKQAQGGASPNPYSNYEHMAPLNQDELDVVIGSNSRVLSPSSSFGLVKESGDLARSIGAFSIGLPGMVAGGALKATGEVSEQLKESKDSTILDFLKSNILAVAAEKGRWPTVFESARALVGAEVQAGVKAVASMFPDAPKKIAVAGDNLIASNADMLKSMGLVPKGEPGAGWMIGQGVGSVVMSVGSTMITKDPKLASSLMAGLVFSGDYQEARSAGLEPRDAISAAFKSTAGQAAVEYIGGKYLLSSSSGGRFASAVKKAIGQGVEEGAQAIIEETVKAQEDIRKTPLSEKATNVAVQAALGLVIGLPVGAVVSFMEEKQPDLTGSQVTEIVTALVKNKDNLSDELAYLLDKERSGAINKKPDEEEVLKRTNEIIALEEAAVKAKAEGGTEDAKIAAWLEAKNTDLSIETRQKLVDIALGKSTTTLEKVQEVVNKIKAEQLGQQTSADEQIRQGRINEIDKRIKEIDHKIDTIYDEITLREEQGRPIARIQARLNKILSERDQLDKERADILTAETKFQKGVVASKAAEKDISIKGKKLNELTYSELLKRRREVNRSIDKTASKLYELFDKESKKIKKEFLDKQKEIQRTTRRVQSQLISIIKENVLDAKDKAKFLDTVKKAQTPEQLEKLIPEIRRRINSLNRAFIVRNARSDIKKVLDKTKTTNVSGKKVGKYSAEIQNLLDEIRGLFKLGVSEARQILDDRLKSQDAVPSRKDALLNKILSVVASGKDVSPTEITDLLSSLRVVVSRAEAFGETKKLTKIEDELTFRDAVFDSITNKKNIDIIDETTFSRRLKRSLEKPAALKDGFMYGWYDIINILVPDKKLRDRLTVSDEIQKAKKITRVYTEELINSGMEAFGFTRVKDFHRQLQKDNEVIDMGEIVNKRGDRIRLQLTKSQLRKLWMEWQDPTLHKTITSEKGNAYSEENLDYIFSFLTKEDRSFALKQLDIYQRLYSDINEVYSKIYGVNLPHNEFYSPIKRVIDKELTSGNFLDEQYIRSTVTSGSLKERVNNINALREQSDIIAFQGHLFEMSHFIAMAEKVSFINSLFGSAKVRKGIEKMHGQSFLSLVDKQVQLLARGARESSGAWTRIIDTLNSNFAVSVLAGKAVMLPKQLVSFIASSAEVPFAEWTVSFQDGIRNYRQVIDTLSQSELMRARGASPERDIADFARRRTLVSSGSKLGRIADKLNIQKMNDFLLLPVKLGDRGAIYFGGWPIYKNAIKNGATHEQAMTQFDRWVAKTQQSSDIDQLSLAQSSNAFVRSMTMFLTAPLSYLRATVRAIRAYKRGEIEFPEFVKKVAIYHMVLPALFQYVADGFEIDDDNMLRSLILGNLNSFFIFGDILAREFANATGEQYRQREPNFAQFFANTVRGVFKLGKGIKEMDWEDINKGMIDISKGVGTGVGLPVSQTQNLIDAVENLDSGDTDKAIKRALGYPKGVVEKKNNQNNRNY